MHSKEYTPPIQIMTQSIACCLFPWYNVKQSSKDQGSWRGKKTRRILEITDK